MKDDRAELLAKLKTMKEPVAQPTVQTYDMGIEYEVASSEGADVVLGRYGAWPAHGPFVVSWEQWRHIERACAENPLAPDLFNGTSLDYLWQQIEHMIIGCGLSDDVALESRREFVARVLATRTNPSGELYAFFHVYGAEPPLFFRSRQELIRHFMSFETLQPWEDMTTEQLEEWSKRVDELKEFALDGPEATEAGGVRP